MDLLPHDVLVRILSFVPLGERLNECSPVCSKFHKAAAEATTAVEICCGRYFLHSYLMKWIALYGSSLTSLRLEECKVTFKHLPCQNLVELVLTDHAVVQLHEGHGAPGLISCCTGLTKLCLVRCHWLGGQAGVEALSKLVHLQHLVLIPLCTPAGSAQLVMPDSLYSLPLTRLELRGSFKIDDSFVQQASKLSNLQSLAFVGGHVTVAGLRSLHHLQHLKHLNMSTHGIRFSSSTTPSIPKLTMLTSLGLETSEEQQLEPSMLAPLTNLVRLSLDVVPVTSCTALLTVLSTLKKLQEVRINGPDEQVDGAGRAAWPPPTSPLFGVFASLPDLRALELRWCCSLPAGVWEQVFPAGRQLTALTELDICWLSRYEDVPMHSPEALLQSSDLVRIVKCCPSLVSLHVDLEPGVQVAELAQLSALPALQQLNLEVQHPGVCIEGLICLTALTQLTQLTCWYALPGDVARVVAYKNEADPDQPPDVWQQLQEHCSEISPYLQPSTAASQQLVQQGQQIEHLQQQVEVLQRQLATEEQKAQGLEQAMVVMSAAHAAELSQLRSLVAQLQAAQQQQQR